MAISRSAGTPGVFIDKTKVENMFKGFETTIPAGARLGIKAIASKYAEIYLEQLPLAGITPWTHRSENILKEQIDDPIRTGKNQYAVLVPSTLIALDQMQPHGVNLLKNRSITAWALAKGDPLVQFKAEIGGSITVKPHPWINDANKKGRRFVRSLAVKEIDKKIRRKGKR